MRLSYTSEFKGEVETLKLKQNPLYHGLGNYEDIDGNIWDIHGVIGNNGKPYVQARIVNANNPYYSTASYAHSYGTHTWIPYYFDVVK